MLFHQYYHKAFTGGQWKVGIKNRDHNEQMYKSIKAPEGQWLADPFLYEYDGKHYLFVEQYFNNINRAGIGVYEIVEGKPCNNQVIIDNPYHMSYPCVFYNNGTHWMIPESSSNQTLDLYRAQGFPFNWIHEKTLIKGRRIVDTTVYERDGTIFLLSYEKGTDGWDLVTYILNMDTYSLSMIARTHYNTNIGRPAGRLFEKDGKLYRPAQNCSVKYGESIIIYEITNLGNESYSEKFALEIKCNSIEFEEKFDRIHTYNMDSEYEVVDFFQEHFDLFNWWKILKRQYLKKL